MFEFEICVHPQGKRYLWFVISDYNAHVLAQGCTKTPARAYIQAEAAKNSLMSELAGAE